MNPTSATANRELPTGFDTALSHVWSWYALHAGQRIQVINFLLVALSVLAAGYAAATGAGQHLAGAGVALGGVATCAVFNVLDARTRELVAASENALAALQELLVQAGFPDTDLYARSCAGVRRAPSYRTSINALTAVAGAGFAVALVAALAS